MDQQLKDMICKHLDVEIDKIAKMPSMTDVSLNNLQKLTDTKKNLLKIELLESQLEDQMRDGSSYRRGYSRMGNSYQQGNSNHYAWEQPGYYDNGYSMTGSDVHSHLENAMRSARNENEREAIRQAMNRINM